MPSSLPVRVVDAENKVLCHMPLASAKAQKLTYQSVALILAVPGQGHIFQWQNPDQIRLPLYMPLPANMAPLSCCESWLSNLGLDQEMGLRKILTLPPLWQTDFSFCFLYKGQCRRNFNPEPERQFFTGSNADLQALAETGCHILPLLELLFSRGIL